MERTSIGIALVLAALLLPLSAATGVSSGEVSGRMVAIDSNQMLVRQAGGYELPILLSDRTRYENDDGTPAAAGPGLDDEVVVRVMSGWTGVVATTVRIQRRAAPVRQLSDQ